MNIEREKFLTALLAIAMTGAAVGCSEDPPPAAEAEPMETTGSEEPLAAPEPPPAADPAPEPAPVPVPEVQPAGPTLE